MPVQLNLSKRRAALDLQVRAWAPFPNTDFEAIWQDNRASVYAWSIDDVRTGIAENGTDYDDCIVLPETLLREPLANGARLVSCVEGVEGQVWIDGFLTLSRWWPEAPSPQDWLLFLRTSGAKLDQMMTDSTPVNPEWTGMPWHHGAGTAAAVKRIANDERFTATACAVLLAPIAYFGVSWLTFVLMTQATELEISRLENDTQSIRENRAEALGVLDGIEELLALKPYPSQFAIMARVHNLLREYDVTMTSWNYSRGQLDFAIEGDGDLDATALIPIFEADPMFNQVGASTRGRSQALVFRMSVSPARELTS